MPSDAVVLALIGMAGGGLGIAVINQFFGHKGKQLEDGTQIRKELWAEIHDIRNQAGIDRGQHQQCLRDLEKLNNKYDELEDVNRDLRRRIALLEKKSED